MPSVGGSSIAPYRLDGIEPKECLPEALARLVARKVAGPRATRSDSFNIRGFTGHSARLMEYVLGLLSNLLFRDSPRSDSTCVEES